MIIQIKGIVFTLLIVSVLSHVEILPGGLLTGEVTKWAENHWNFIKTGHHMTSTMTEAFGDTCYNEKKYTDAVTGKVIQIIPEISDQLAELSGIVEKRRLNLLNTMNKLELEIPANVQLSALIDRMGEIDGLYEELSVQVVAQRMKQFDGSSFCSFAYRQVYGDVLSAKVDRVHNIIVPSQNLETTSWLIETYKALEAHNETLCGTGHSTLDYFYSIYISLMTVEIKAYVMTVFSHNLLFNFRGAGPLCIYGQNPNDEISRVQMNFKMHVQDYNRLFSKLMKGISREFRACDRGKDFLRDETFFELEGAMQVMIVAQHPSHNIKCSSIPRYGSAALCSSKTKFCRTPVTRNCLGSYHYCWRSNYWIGGCLAPKNSSRRYEFLWESYPDYTIDGDLLRPDVLNCPRDRQLLSFLWPLCFCECIDNAVDSQSTHVINLKWVESDVSRNMIITGIRFIVKHRVMQFQIQQGKLNSHFRVEDPEWKPVDDISEAIRAARLNRKLHGKLPGVVENEDYFILSPPDKINFDTLIVSYPNVLTGVKFSYTPYKTGDGGIKIQIKGTKFHHTTGALCKDCKTEIVESTISHRKFYNYNKENVANPTFPTKPVTSPGQSTYISVSSKLTDSGQTTLPYFDALPLVSSPSAPLAGLGIFHKTADNFTGFVSLKFVSLDYSKYLEKSAENERTMELQSTPVKKKSSYQRPTPQ